MPTIVSYQCPNCEAALSFHPDKGLFHCEYCLSDFTEADLTKREEEKQRKKTEANAQEQARFENELEAYYCPNCGAEVACTGNTVADICCYCHTPVIHRGKLSGEMKPDKIIPFRFDREQAKEAFTDFARKHRFVPKEFRSPEQIEKIQGIYYPFWVTDADTESNLEADGTRVRTWRTGNYRYTETSHYRIERTGEIHFEDITTSALTEADKEMLEGVLPFPSDALQPFSMPYLSGFLTKKRDISSDSLKGEVHRKMEQYATTLLRGTVHGFNTVNVKDVDVNLYREGWEYALMPLWILVWRDKKGKSYTYAMNGHTGKVWGQLPVHYPKLLAWGGGLAAAILAVATLIGGLLL